MRGEAFLDALEWVDVDLIEAADGEPAKKRNYWKGWLSTAACLVLAAAVGIPLAGWLNSAKSSGTAGGMVSGSDSLQINQDPANGAEQTVSIAVNQAKGIGSADLDVQYLAPDDPEAFAAFTGMGYDSFLAGIPDIFTPDSSYALAARAYSDAAREFYPDAGEEEYCLHDYVFTYKTEAGGSVKIALCAFEEPLRCTVFVADPNPKLSRINDVPLAIYGYKTAFMARFSCRGIYYDIEASDVTLDELIALLTGLTAE